MDDVVTEGVTTSAAATRQTELTVAAAISSGAGDRMREQAISEREEAKDTPAGRTQ
jgi:hypothetical protein